MRRLNNILVTGGAGFIGSNFIRKLLSYEDYSGSVVNADSLTYAGNLENLAEIDKAYGGKRYFFEETNICDHERIKSIFKKYEIDTVVHFAAESHVDRSIFGPKEFVETNIIGTFTLLEVAREIWKDRDDVLFHHINCFEIFFSVVDNLSTSLPSCPVLFFSSRTHIGYN